MPDFDSEDPVDISLLAPAGDEEKAAQFVDEPLPVLEYRRKGSAALPPPCHPTQTVDVNTAWTPALRIVRRLCFAMGMAMFGHGLGGRSEYASTMGWGLFFAGLCIPLGKL